MPRVIKVFAARIHMWRTHECALAGAIRLCRCTTCRLYLTNDYINPVSGGINLTFHLCTMKLRARDPTCLPSNMMPASMWERRSSVCVRGLHIQKGLSKRAKQHECKDTEVTEYSYKYEEPDSVRTGIRPPSCLTCLTLEGGKRRHTTRWLSASLPS